MGADGQAGGGRADHGALVESRGHPPPHRWQGSPALAPGVVVPG